MTSYSSTARGSGHGGGRRLLVGLAALVGIIAIAAVGWFGATMLGRVETGQTPRDAQTYQTASSVQLRSAPGTAGRVIGTLREGTRVAGWPAGTIEGVDWIEVTAIDGARGFLPAGDLAAVAPAAAPGDVVPGTRRIITSAYVNLRATPSLSGQVVATAEGGTRLVADGSIQSEGETWLRVPLTADVTGWVAQRFTTADEESASGSDEGFDPAGGLVGVAGEARNPVNVQATPSQDARVVRALQAGEPVRILGQTMAAGWWYVLRLPDGSQGFAPKDSIAVTGQLGRWLYPDGTEAPGPGIPQGSQAASQGSGSRADASDGSGARDGFTVQVNPEAAAQAGAAEASGDPATPAGPAPDAPPPQQ